MAQLLTDAERLSLQFRSRDVVADILAAIDRHDTIPTSSLQSGNTQ